MPQLDVAFYFARSSLAALGGAPMLQPSVLEKISSPFQRRQVQADMRKDVLATLEVCDCDAILIDFIDQRFKVLSDGKGGLLTLSAEYLRAAPRPNSTRVYSKETEKFKDLWQAGLLKFHRALSSNPRRIRVLINEAYWASDALNQGFSTHQLEEAAVENDRLMWMYRSARDLFGEQALKISYTSEDLVGDPAHKWGLAPFHYVPRFYQHTLESLISSVVIKS